MISIILAGEIREIPRGNSQLEEDDKMKKLISILAVGGMLIVGAPMVSMGAAPEGAGSGAAAGGAAGAAAAVASGVGISAAAVAGVAAAVVGAIAIASSNGTGHSGHGK